MFTENFLFSRVYMIGIGGVSMSSLALLLREKGILVRGSDRSESIFTQKLINQGIPVSIGEEEEISENVVVYTGAVESTHPQLLAAKKAGKRLVSRAELLGMIAEEYPHVISVAGCHGKTTVTSMLANVFLSANKKFTAHIGGEDLNLGNYCHTGNEYFITEACEFQRSFLRIKSETAVVLNTDFDHTDCYNSHDELLNAYDEFSCSARNAVFHSKETKLERFSNSVTFGLYSGDYTATKLVCNQEKYSFILKERGIESVRINLNVIGKIHVVNALAAYAIARLYSITPLEIKRGIEQFQGVKRRFELIGTLGGVFVICDYAHHPKEIEEAYRTATRLCRGTVRLVFQPHTYTRTKDLMSDFVTALSKADCPIVYKTYSAREVFQQAGSAYTLVSKLDGAVYVQSPNQLKKRLRSTIQSNDLILVLGAGDIYDIANKIIDDENPSE